MSTVKAKPAKKLDINLLPKDPFFESPVGKVLRWSLSVGRYIVIFTELIVIISFASRFSLDRQVTDLNDEINQRQAIISSFGDLENRIRLAQQKIDQYQQTTQQADIIEIFPRLSQLTPREVKLESLEIRPTSVSFEAVTLSQNSLNVLINNLQLSPDVFNVSVDKIESSQEDDGGFKFRIKFDTQPPKTRGPAPAPRVNPGAGGQTTTPVQSRGVDSI